MNKFQNIITLLRFPFSLLLLPVFLFAVSQTPSSLFQLDKFFIVFFILHGLVYPSSNGFNSFVDKDTGSIGGIKNPPLPPKELFLVTILMDLLAVLISFFFIDFTFCLLVSGCVFASRAYSAKSIRLKKHPIFGFLVVFILQGGYTYLMVFYGITGQPLKEILNFSFLPILFSSFMLGGSYPLTQIYQHEQDKKSEDISLSILLGYQGTFIFCIISFIIANSLLFKYFYPNDLFSFVVFQIGMFPIFIFFIWWFLQTWKNPNQANFKNTMKMNIISALSMNVTYIVIWWMNY